MNNIAKEIFNIDRNVVSKTAYRALLLLSLLIKSGISKNKIISTFYKDPILKKKFADDTITNTINTLKIWGCEIQRPSPANDYKYTLVNHPLKLNIDENLISELNKIRLNACNFYDHNVIFEINTLYAKVAENLKDKELAGKILNEAPFSQYNAELIKTLDDYCKNKQSVTIQYNSPKNGLESLDFVADEIRYENLRIYLWGYNCKYEEYSYLRLDRVKTIEKIPLKYKLSDIQPIRVRYKLTGSSRSMFLANDYESIVEAYEDYIIIEANVKNKFNFMQRILYFASDCTIIAPESFKTEVLEHIISIKRGYEN